VLVREKRTRHCYAKVCYDNDHARSSQRLTGS
jgi:hypothetical protein